MDYFHSNWLYKEVEWLMDVGVNILVAGAKCWNWSGQKKEISIMFPRVANGKRNKNCVGPLIKDNGDKKVLWVFSDMLSPIVRPRPRPFVQCLIHSRGN